MNRTEVIAKLAFIAFVLGIAGLGIWLTLPPQVHP